MSRVIFLASGVSHEFRGDKERRWWEERIMQRGLRYELNKDGRDTNIIVDDRGDPFLEPKQKPSVGVTESHCKD